jgi:hypothetical protein
VPRCCINLLLVTDSEVAHLFAHTEEVFLCGSSEEVCLISGFLGDNRSLQWSLIMEHAGLSE